MQDQPVMGVKLEIGGDVILYRALNSVDGFAG
jgi:hypothetical protein